MTHGIRDSLVWLARWQLDVIRYSMWQYQSYTLSQIYMY